MAMSEMSLVRDMQIEVCKRLKPIFRDLGGWRADDTPGLVIIDEWSPDNMSLCLNPPEGGKKNRRKRINRVVFKGLYYPEQVRLVDGQPKVHVLGRKPIPEYSNKLIDHTSLPSGTEVDKSHIYFNKALEHETSFETSVSAESTTTVKAEGPTVSFEQQIKLAVTAALAERNQRNYEDGIDEYILVAPGKKLLYTIASVEVLKETPVDFIGYPDFNEIRLDFEDWMGAKRTDPAGNLLSHSKRLGWRKEVTVSGFTGLEQLLKGGDWRFPEMRSYLAVANTYARDAAHWLFDKEHRAIRVSDTLKERYEDTLELQTTITSN